MKNQNSTSEQLVSLHSRLGFAGMFEANLVEYPFDERADRVIVVPFLRDFGRVNGLDTSFRPGFGAGPGYGEAVALMLSLLTRSHPGEVKDWAHQELTTVFLIPQAAYYMSVVEEKIPNRKGVVNYHAFPASILDGEGIAIQDSFVRAGKDESYIVLGTVQALVAFFTLPESKEVRLMTADLFEMPAAFRRNLPDFSDDHYSVTLGVTDDGNLFISDSDQNDADSWHDLAPIVVYPGVDALTPPKREVVRREPTSFRGGSRY